MNPYRTEKVLVDIRKRNVAQPIAVCASTDVEIELSVFADGNAYDCTGLTGVKAVFYISQDGRADTFQAVEAKRGKLVFRIPADHLGYPGEYRWQVIVAVEDKLSEWARGDFFIRTNPAADFEPMQLLDPPWLKSADFDNVEEVSVGILKNVTAKVNELVRILKGAAGVLALALVAVTAQGIPFDEVLPSTPVNTNLIGAVIGEGLSLSNGVLSSTGEGGGLSTNDVRAIIEADAGPTNRIVRKDEWGDVTLPSMLNVGDSINLTRAGTLLSITAGPDSGAGEFWGGEWRYVPGDDGPGREIAVKDDLTPLARTDSLGSAAYRDAGDFATKADEQLVYQLVMGSNVVAEVTNYNSRTRSPQLRLLQLDPDTKKYFPVWTETNGLTRTLNEAKAHTDAATNALGLAKADRAWSHHTSGLGADAPAGVTWISTPETVVAGGYEYAKQITSHGEVWVLTSNGMGFGGDTNSFFAVRSGDGETLFSIEKTDSILVGVDADGISVSGGVVTIPLGVVSQDPPVCYAANSLVNAVWADLSEVGLPAWVESATVSGEPGAWVWRIETTAPSAFFQFRVLQPGATVIRNNAQTDLSAGLLVNGTRYYPHDQNGTLIWTTTP